MLLPDQTDRVEPDRAVGFAVRESDDRLGVIRRRVEGQRFLLKGICPSGTVDRLGQFQSRSIVEQDLCPTDSRRGDGCALGPEGEGEFVAGHAAESQRLGEGLCLACRAKDLYRSDAFLLYGSIFTIGDWREG